MSDLLEFGTEKRLQPAGRQWESAVTRDFVFEFGFSVTQNRERSDDSARSVLPVRLEVTTVGRRPWAPNALSDASFAELWCRMTKADATFAEP